MTDVRFAAYCVASTVPTIATPRAPATWRTVFCTAEPAPARASGRTFCRTVDPGAITLPMPKPKTKNTARTAHSGVSIGTRASRNIAIATSTRPDRHDRLVAEPLDHRGAARSGDELADRERQEAQARRQGRVAAQDLQVERQREGDARHREEGEAHGGQADGVPAVRNSETSKLGWSLRASSHRKSAMMMTPATIGQMTDGASQSLVADASMMP